MKRQSILLESQKFIKIPGLNVNPASVLALHALIGLPLVIIGEDAAPSRLLYIIHSSTSKTSRFTSYL